MGGGQIFPPPVGGFMGVGVNPTVNPASSRRIGLIT